MKSDEQIAQKPDAEAEIENGYQSYRLREFLARAEFPVPDQPRDVQVERCACGEPDKLEDGKAIREIFSYGNLFFRVTTKREFSQTAKDFFPG